MKTRAKQQLFLLRAAAVLLVMLLTMTAQTAWADTETVSYIDADGKTKTVPATVLTGNEPVDNSGSIRLAPGWYVVGSDFSHSGQLNLDGNVNLILADGKTMTASGVRHGIGGDGFLTIYGQAQGTGTLNATGTDDVGIYVVDGVTINGGTVNTNGIMSDGNVTINGGKVTSTGDPGILSNSGNIILGWTSPADRITADSYISYSGIVKVADGQGLTDGSGNSYSGTLTADDINEKTLQPHWAGNGSSASPYTISRPQELNLLAHRVNGTHGEPLREDGYKDTYFKLANDINYSHATDWDDKNSTENNYEAIGYYDGSNYRYFSGHFDGASHTVSGIRIHRSGYDYADKYQGLFGQTASATIKGIILADARITGYDDTGGIVGYTGGGTVTDCHVANDVCIHAAQTNAFYHGGIAGENNGTIEYCTSAATLTIPSGTTSCRFYGGIAGYNGGNGTLTDNLAIGAVVPAASQNSHGAIVGWNLGTLQNNYYTACKVGSESVTPSGVGCGYINDSSVADVTANDGAVPGYFLTLGENLSIASGATDFTIPAHGETAAVTYHVAAEGAQVTLSTGCEGYQMHNVTYNDGTADHTVSPDGDGKYIFTMPAANVSVTAKVDVIPWSGDGSEDDPYIIQYPSQLDLLAYRVNGTHGETLQEDGYENKFFKLANDISYSHTTDWDDKNSTENNYETIGYFDGSNERYFEGHFDGASHTVSGIRIHRSGYDYADKYQGLFGQTAGATIKGIILADARITGYDDTGGIVGYTGGGTVTDCHVANDVCIHAVQTDALYHGGIVGDNYGTVENCTSAATLTILSGTTSCQFYGGIAGYNGGTLTDNLAIGAVVPALSYNSHGAITGGNEVTLKNNYYTACKVGSADVTPSGVGCGYINDSSVADVTDNDGAVPGYFITLGENLSIASGATTFFIPAHGETAAVTCHVAAEGAQVTLSTGCEGYQMHNVTYNDGTADHTVSPDGDGKYIFTMPAANVSVTANVGVISWEGNGEKDDPYLIEFPSQLDLLAHRVNGTHGETLQADGYKDKYFQLANDINYSHATDWDDANSTENNFEAIGGYYDSTRRYFEGYFDGAGHTVSGIRIYKDGNDNADHFQGLFGQTVGATIKGITLADARITGDGETGGIVGYIYADGTINDCHVANNVCIHAVQSDAWHHGGIVGYTLGCTVKNCTSAATLTIPSGDTNCQYYGAIAGYADVSDPHTEGGDLIDNLAIGATVLAVDNAHGAIVGANRYNRLKHNYYTACKVGSADVTPSGVGSGFRDNSSVADITGDDDAVPAMRDDADNSTAIGLFAALASTDNGHTPVDLGWGAGKYPMQLAGRTLYKDGAWNTLCLPFDLELSGSVLDGDGVDVRTLAGSDFSDGTLTLDFTQAGAVTTLEAGKPYIVRWAKPDNYVAYDGTNAAECSDLVCPVFNGVTVNTATANVGTSYVDFIGILSPTVLYEDGTEKTNLYMGSDNKLYYPTVEGFKLNACRGYFKLKGVSVNGNGNGNGNGVRSFNINFGDDATGIVEMRDEKGEMRNGHEYEDGGWYTVDGRRLDGKPSRRGLYIHNGLKVVIK